MKSSFLPSSAVMSLWWFPAVVGLVLVMGTMLVLVPQVKSIGKLNQELKQIQADLTKAQAKVSQVGLLDQNRIDDLQQIVKIALPPQKPYYEVLLALQINAERTGVSLGDFSINPGSLATESAEAKSSQPTGLVSLPTSLSVQGTTEQVTEFVIGLQNTLPLMKISGISISGDRIGALTDTRQAQIDFVIAYLIDPPVKSQIGLEPLPPLASDVDQIYTTLQSYDNPIAIVEQIDPPLIDSSRVDLFNF